jgi:hypothetical protein
MRAVKLRPWIRRITRVKRLKPSDVIAVCSVIIAIIAAGLSGYSAYLQREHDRLSVRPSLLVSFTYNDTGVGWTYGNRGLGPARLRGFRIFIDKVEQKPPTAPVEFSDLIVSGLHLPVGGKYQFRNPSAGQMITTSEPSSWFWVNSAPINEILKSEYRRVQIEFCYCSMYDECWFGWSGVAVSVRDDKCSAFSKEPLSNWWQG